MRILASVLANAWRVPSNVTGVVWRGVERGPEEEHEAIVFAHELFVGSAYGHARSRIVVVARSREHRP